SQPASTPPAAPADHAPLPPGATDSMFSIFMDSQIRNPYLIGMALHLRNRRQFDNPPSNHFHDER
ncbi:TPA: hypothetical protein ACGR8D_006353, partial [Burkholderia cenocepacia]